MLKWLFKDNASPEAQAAAMRLSENVETLRAVRNAPNTSVASKVAIDGVIKANLTAQADVYQQERDGG